MCRWYLRKIFFLPASDPLQTDSLFYCTWSIRSVRWNANTGRISTFTPFSSLWSIKGAYAAASDPSGPRFHFHRSGMLLICQLQVSLFISRTEPTAFHGSWQITSVYSDCKTSIWGDIMDTRPLLALLLGLLTCELMVGANDGHMCFVHRKPLFLPQQPVCS